MGDHLRPILPANGLDATSRAMTFLLDLIPTLAVGLAWVIAAWRFLP